MAKEIVTEEVKEAESGSEQMQARAWGIISNHSYYDAARALLKKAKAENIIEKKISLGGYELTLRKEE